MAYIFGLFWMIRRPNVLIVVGGVLSICMIVLLVVLLVSLFAHDPPLAVGGTATKLRVFFALKTAFSALAQLGCGLIAFFNLYSFPRAFKYANRYMFMAMAEVDPSDPSSLSTKFDTDGDMGSYVPPTFSESRSPTVELDAAAEDLLSDSRETQSM